MKRTYSIRNPDELAAFRFQEKWRVTTRIYAE